MKARFKEMLALPISLPVLAVPVSRTGQPHMKARFKEMLAVPVSYTQFG